jgi:hypothetical protein
MKTLCNHIGNDRNNEKQCNHRVVHFAFSVMDVLDEKGSKNAHHNANANRHD